MIRDLAFLIGLAACSYGAWMVYQPAGLIVPGVVLMAVAVFGNLRGGADGGLRSGSTGGQS